MGAGANLRLTRTVWITLMLGMAALAGATEGIDSVSAMRALAATIGRTKMVGVVVAPSAIASGSGFARTYGGPKSESGYLIGQAGSNYVFGGITESFGLGTLNPWLSELDGNGNLILQQVWGTAQTQSGVVMPTPDGGYAVSLVSQTAPGQTVMQLIKLNSSFASVWQKQYGSGGVSLLTSAVVLPDNSFLIEGSTLQISGTSFTFVVEVIKTDASGNIVWQQDLSSSDAIALGFQQLADGSFIGVGTIAVGLNDTDILVVKLDSGGNVTWQKRYGGPLADEAYSALAISGGYLIPGTTASFGAGKTDVWLLQLDGSGNLVKQEAIGGAGDEFALIQQVTGGYLLSGATDSSGAGGRDGWLAFLDSSLNVTSSKTYGGPGDESFVAIPDSAGGFLLEGSTTSFGGGGEDSWVIKTDASGTPIWQNAYGGPADEFGAAVRISGGGLMLSGSTASWGAGGTDMFAALLDANGQLADCGLVHPTTVTPANFPVTVTATNVTPVATTLAVANGANTSSTIALSGTTTSAVVADICGAPGALTATASVNTASGPAPLSVNFTGSAAGGTSPYGFDWSFGDGSAHSGQQNPTHVYTSPGSYSVVLKVTDATAATATDSHLDITVSGAASPVVITTTSPLPAGTVGVTYSLQFAATGGTGGYTWSVVSGSLDGLSLSTGGLFAGTPTASGDFSLTVNVTDSANSTAQGTFAWRVNSSISYTYSTWVPMAAHNGGRNQSQWRSDLGLLNTGSVTANVQISFFSTGGIVGNTTSVPAGTQSILTDVVGQLGASGQGALQILSDQPLKITSRTYNQVSSDASCYPSATQGQDYPAVVASDGLAAGQSAYLAGLAENASYRCNIGLVNVGSGAAMVLVELYDGAGTKLTDYTVPLAAGQWAQETQPFLNKARQTAMDRGYAKITVQSGSGVFGFASVMDNLTNDPTTVAMQVSAPFVVVWVPVAAHNGGRNQSQWRSDVGLLNTGVVTANTQITFFGSGGVMTKMTHVPAGTQSILTDVVAQLGATGQGALKIASDQPLTITSRTYNQVSPGAACYPSGTQGQDYPAVTFGDGLSAGQSAYLAGLTENASYRCNIGVVNVGSGAASVTVELYDATGHLLTSYQVNLSAGQWQQATQPFKNEAGQTAMAAGYAKITVNSGSGVLAYAALVDNITNDPTTINMLR